MARPDVEIIDPDVDLAKDGWEVINANAIAAADQIEQDGDNIATLETELADEVAEREQLSESAVRSVNQVVPDDNGNVTMPVVGLFSMVESSPKPTITKCEGNPVISQADSGLSSLYLPCIVRMPDSIFNTYPQYGRWRIYTSTDHDTGNGGIITLYSTPNVDILDPGAADVVWAPYSPSGSLYTFQDNGHGKQTEGAYVIWREDLGQFVMYYQVDRSLINGTQTTYIATSADGLTWTATESKLTNPSSKVLGYDHNGYAKVFNRDGLWYCYHLAQDGNWGGYMFSYSNDGFNWVTGRDRIMHGLQWTDGRLRIGLGPIFLWRGEPWTIGSMTEFVSGTGVSSHTYRFMAPLDETWTRLAGRPRVFTLPAQTYENGIDSGGAWNLALEPRTEKLYAAYRSGPASGSTSYIALLEVS